MSKSPTIMNDNALPNDHAGIILLEEFMQPLELDSAALAAKLAVRPEHIDAVINGEKSVDAELDLRLARYFGLSEGYFLRLQAAYELLEAKRALNGELDKITPRAA